MYDTLFMHTIIIIFNQLEIMIIVKKIKYKNQNITIFHNINIISDEQ